MMQRPRRPAPFTDASGTRVLTNKGNRTSGTGVPTYRAESPYAISAYVLRAVATRTQGCGFAQIVPKAGHTARGAALEASTSTARGTERPTAKGHTCTRTSPYGRVGRAKTALIPSAASAAQRSTVARCTNASTSVRCGTNIGAPGAGKGPSAAKPERQHSQRCS